MHDNATYPTWSLDQHSIPQREAVPGEGIQRRMLALEDEVIRLLRRVNRAGSFVQAERVFWLERTLERQAPAKRAFATSSGTAALRIAYACAKLMYGSGSTKRRLEIITTPLTYFSTCSAASDAGLTVKFVDVDPHTFNIDPLAVARAITPDTVAIVPVHLHGRPAAMAELLQLSRANDIALIEDAAQAFGATYMVNGQRQGVGSRSNFAALSFYCGKNVGGLNDAGALYCNDPEMAPYILGLRDQGRSTGERYEHRMNGFKFRMDELNAAVIQLQIQKYMEPWLARRREIAHFYSSELAGIEELTLPPPDQGHVYYKYAVLLPDSKERSRLEQHFKARKIGYERIYPRLVCDQLPYANGELPCIIEEDNLPNARNVVERLLCLPMHEFIRGDEIARVVEAVRSAFSS
jgi:dTDP-4-amino-4,6-dideoxygalactose transaminase